MPSSVAQERPREPALEPDLPIIDTHHHLWSHSLAALHGRTLDDPHLTGFERQSLKTPRYLIEELLNDINTGGHNVCATVFVQAFAMHRADGPDWLAPIGETEFVNGVAAMSASGLFGKSRLCAGIVGYADLRHPRVQETLEAHIRAGNGRFRGVRQGAGWDADPAILGRFFKGGPQLFGDPDFRAGFARLAPLGLSFDAWLLEPQLPDLIDLARAFPDTQIVLDHLGTPLGIGTYAGRRAEIFPRWRARIRELSTLPNVSLKIGGLGMECLGFPSFRPGAGSADFAADWRPYVETCVEAFGAARCMFESNFPVDGAVASYGAVWNAFKRIVAAASADEKSALFCDTAKRFYRLDL